MSDTPPRGGGKVTRSSPPPDESKTPTPTPVPGARPPTLPPGSRPATMPPPGRVTGLPPPGRAPTMPPPGRPPTLPPPARARTMPPPEGRGSRTSVPTSVPEEGYPTPPPGSHPGTIELERNQYHLIRYIDAHRLAVITRLPQQYRNIEDLRWSFERMHRAFDHIPKSRCALLIDSRQAPARNDPEFEKAMAPLRQDLLRGFSRTAILVQTAVGALQVTRHAKNDALPTGVCTSLVEALLHLGLTKDDRLIAMIELPAPLE